ELLAVTEVVPDEGGEELDGDDRLVEAVPFEQSQHVLHDRAVGHREQRLGLVRGHRPQARPLAPCHDDGLQWFRGSFPVPAIMCTPSPAESRTLPESWHSRITNERCYSPGFSPGRYTASQPTSRARSPRSRRPSLVPGPGFRPSLGGRRERA